MAYGKPDKGTPWLLVGGGAVFVIALVTLLVMRSGDGGPDGTVEPGTAAEIPVTVIPPPEQYPDPPADGVWETTPLEDERYVQVTSEATCRAQSFHGPPETLAVEMNRIYFHYETSALEIAAFAADVNADDTRAVAVGERIATAIERCP